MIEELKEKIEISNTGDNDVRVEMKFIDASVFCSIHKGFPFYSITINKHLAEQLAEELLNHVIDLKTRERLNLEKYRDNTEYKEEVGTLRILPAN
jgi:hypothetical protein